MKKILGLRIVLGVSFFCGAVCTVMALDGLSGATSTEVSRSASKKDKLEVWPNPSTGGTLDKNKTCNYAGFCVDGMQDKCYTMTPQKACLPTNPALISAYIIRNKRKLGVCQTNFEPAINLGCTSYPKKTFLCVVYDYYESVKTTGDFSVCMDWICDKGDVVGNIETCDYQGP